MCGTNLHTFVARNAWYNLKGVAIYWYKKDPTPGAETSQRPPSEGFCFVCPSLYFLLRIPV
jgi:hypothetical protein